MKRTFLLIAVFGLFGFAQEAAPPAKADHPLLGYVAIPDLMQSLQTIDEIVQYVAPGTLPAGMLVGQIGMVVGDPELTNLDITKPVVAMVYGSQGSPMPHFALFIPTNDPETYATSLSGMGMQTEALDNMVILGRLPEDLALGKQYLVEYAGLSVKGKGDVQLHLEMEPIMAAYGPMIESMTAPLKQGMESELNKDGQPGADAVMEIMDLYINGITSAIKQTKSMTFGFHLQPKSAAVSMTFAPKTGTEFAKMVAANHNKNQNAVRYLPQNKGFVELSMNYDSKSVADFALDLIGAEASGPFITLLKDYMNDSKTWFSGDLAFSMGMSGDQMVYAIAAEMQKKGDVLPLLEKYANHFQTDGAIGKFYSDLGMQVDVALAKNARKHKGVDVHSYSVKFDMSGMGQEEQDIMKKLPLSYEFAVVDKIMLVNSHSEQLNGMIEIAKSGGGQKMLTSMKAVKNQNVYFDIDLGAMFKDFIPAFAPEDNNQEMKEMAEALGNVKPISMTASFQNGVFEGRYHIPLDFIAEIVKMEQAKKEAMAQQEMETEEETQQ